MDQPERNAHYTNALTAALEEYAEVDSQVKKLGKRLGDLRMTIRGLSGLQDLPIPEAAAPGQGTVVVTEETRRQAADMSRRKT